MGLFGLLFDAMALSAGAAGVRRITGYSAKEFVYSHIKNPAAKGACFALRCDVFSHRADFARGTGAVL